MASDRNKFPAVVLPHAGGAAQSSASYRREFFGLDEIGQLLKRYGPLVLATSVAGLVFGAIWALMTPASYTASAQLVIDPKAVQLSREDARDQSGAVEAAQVESQMAVMRSERIAAIVVKRLGLLGEPMFAKAVRGAPTPEVAIQTAAYVLGSSLTVRRQGMSYVIDVAFSAPNPALAARVATAVAETYVDDARDARTGSARVGAEWLERRVAQLRQSMNDAALALQEFKAGRDYRIYRRDPQAGGAPGAGSAPEARAAEGKAPEGKSGEQNVRFDRNTLEELETTSQSYRKIYEAALQGYAEAVQRQSNPLIDTRLLAPATQPLGKSHPRTKLIIALGGLIGFLFGSAAGVLHRNLDRSLRTASDAREALGAPCLGVLPILWRPALRRGWFAGRSSRARLRSFIRRLGRRFYPPSTRPFRQWDFITPDPFEEAMANVVTMMATLEREQSVRVIGVTSARRGEGKSTAAGNLACLLAASGFRILLIDADFRRGSLSRAAGFNENGNGLAHVLLGRARVRDSLVAGPTSGVTLLPVETSAGATFDALLGSGAMNQCLDEALAGHDVVIIDLPSLEESPAAMAVAPLLSGVVMIVQWGSTSAGVAANAVNELRGVGGRIIGSILNKAA